MVSKVILRFHYASKLFYDKKQKNFHPFCEHTVELYAKYYHLSTDLLDFSSLFSDVMCKIAPAATKTGFKSDIGLAVMILPPIT